ncbi:hypothetical protein KKE60_04355 [Patescibacteria group bacterium]|nr:hypothetical protein [Patescibacteria group bacterium]
MVEEKNKTAVYVAGAGLVVLGGVGLLLALKKKPPTPPPEYPTTDIRQIAITVIGPEYPVTDIRNVVISVVGVEYPTTDIRNIVMSVVGPEYPITDIKNIVMIIVGVEYPITDIKNVIISVVAAPPAEYTLSATATAGGYVSPASMTVNEGEIATITAYPYSGYEFDHWEREGLVSYSNPYMAIMLRDISIVAYFRWVAPPPPAEYTLSATATAGGYVSPPAVTVNEGETATITAYPYSGYEFDHWIREGLISYSNPYMAIMYRNISIVAYFRMVAPPPPPPPPEEPPPPPPPVCVEGSTMWVGGVFYYCENGQWRTPPVI